MNKAYTYKLATEFSRYPGGRYKTDGPYSGEQFREEVLLPLLKKHDVIEIDLTGAVGYGVSFLDEAFGETAKVLGREEIDRRLKFVCKDDPVLVSIVWEKIEKAIDS